MITDIIDLLVDLSNSFGSLTNAIFARFRNYRSYILENNELSTDAVDCIINAIPEIKKELSLSKLDNGYILISRKKVNSIKATLDVVFLDISFKYRHSFSVLKPLDLKINNIQTPCFWMIK